MQTKRKRQSNTMRVTVLVPAAIGLAIGLWYGIQSAEGQGVVPPPTERSEAPVQSITLPTDRAGMTAQLIAHTKESDLANIALSKAKPEETFEIVRDHWKDLNSAEAKEKLLSALVISDNPHLLEVLDMGVNDTTPTVRNVAFDLLQNFAYQNFRLDPAAYKTWYTGIAGKPVAEVVATGCAAFVAEFNKADEVQRLSLLNILMRLDLEDTDGLARVRRHAALDAGLLTGLEQTLTTPALSNPGIYSTVSAMQVVRHLQPDDSFVQRTIWPLTARNGPPAIRWQASAFLGAVNSGWSSDRLFDMLIDDYPSRDRWVFVAAFSNSTDPHLIPKMIALLEADDTPQTAQLLGVALPRLTGVKFDGLHDGGWWHVWWDRNKTNFPEDVQAVPYPKVTIRSFSDSNALSVRRHAEVRLIGDDAQKAYWLLCPAYIAPTSDQDAPVSATHKPALGLIVALADGAGNGEDLTDFWRDAIQKSLKDGYFVALPIAPKWSAHQPMAWVTQQNMAQVKEAKFSTEALLNDIIADVSTRYPIDPNRLFLHGVGNGGMAAYSCSLNPTTPFKGFYILSSPFKAAQLPPLTHAKGRRYLIQQSKEDKLVPYFQAVAADDLLRKQAAVVKLIATKGEHGYKFAASPWEQLTQSIAWLEAPH